MKYNSTILLFLLLGYVCPGAGIKNTQTDGNYSFPKVITKENSDLPSNEVYALFIDASDVAWIGTDKGLSRFDGEKWIQYSTDDHLKNNKINEISYERTAYGDEIWIATDGGLTVTSYDTDGITAATTYTNETSKIVGTKVNAVMVDYDHNKWVGTDSAINVFRGGEWFHQLSGPDSYGDPVNFTKSNITAIAAYQPDSMAFITTNGNGVVRIGYNDVDGFTGASTYAQPWASLTSDQLTAVAVKGETQWYGSNAGALYHPDNQTKGTWDWYTVEDKKMLDNYITDIHIANDSKVWIGTKKGLNIIDESGAVHYYSENMGLVNNTINTITSDTKGNVWIGTNGGIEWFEDIPGYVTNVNSLNLVNDKVTVYPNPAISYINVEIKVERPQLVRASIYNNNGQLMEIALNDKFNLKRQSINIDITNKTKYKKGIYIIRVDTEDYIQVSKVSIQ